MSRGLDRESLEIVLDSLGDFAKQHLSEEVLLDFDARDEMPLEIVREMCGPELGIQLVFVPEEYGGMGGGAFDVYRVCEALARIDCPTLVVRGAASDILSPEVADRMVDDVLERGSLAVVPQAGHSVMTDNPEGFREAVTSFVLE